MTDVLQILELVPRVLFSNLGEDEERLIEEGAYLLFPKLWSDTIGVFVIYMYVCVSPSEVSEGYSGSLELHVRDITPLASLGL